MKKVIGFIICVVLVGCESPRLVANYSTRTYSVKEKKVTYLYTITTSTRVDTLPNK